MTKKIIPIFLLFLSFTSLASGNEEYREKMRDLIREIRANTTNDRIIITQNGSEVYFKNGEPDQNFLPYVNGASQESLFYGEEGKLGKKTSNKERNSLLKNLIQIKSSGKTVLDVNYSKNKNNRKNIEEENKKYGFIGEEIPSFTADVLNVPIKAFNRKDIYSLEDAENFLYLLNPHKFKDVDEYFRILSNTDYDVLIIEPSFNGMFFTKEQIKKLKYKSTGERRLVIAYFSIGEAENYRDYWKPEWNKKLPSWMEAENENWEGNFIIKYWSDEWRNIIKTYQQKLDYIGVDGYYLDTIDSFYYFENKES